MNKLPESFNYNLLGGLVGDFVGSRFERAIFSGDTFGEAVCTGYDKPPAVNRTGNKATDFDFFAEGNCFTDDTVLTVALMEWLLGDEHSAERLIPILRQYYTRYPDRGFGKGFKDWAQSTDNTFNHSWGNGAAMRILPVAYAAKSEDELSSLARASAIVTHNNEGAINGATAVARATWFALQKYGMGDVLKFGMTPYRYSVLALDTARKTQHFSSKAIDTVPLALSAFAAGESYADVIRKAISLGGEADTIAAMAGTVAGAYFGVPKELAEQYWPYLDSQLQCIVIDFDRKFCCK